MARNRRLLDSLGIDLPIIQAPMAGANGSAMAVAVSEAGGLGSLPCAMLSGDKVRAEIGIIRQQTAKPFNVISSATPRPPPTRPAPPPGRKVFPTTTGSSASTRRPRRRPSIAHPSTRPCATWSRT